MSSAVTAVASTDDNVAAAAAEKKPPPRRFPPPCWTQEETLVLIGAYRERWYAARRGYLRTADWDAVAAAVAERCPGASPPKTSAQCRHKMEKLRQRYRAEKQRAALSFPCPPGRNTSPWFFFENMDAMENGTAPPAPGRKPEDPPDGSQLNSPHLEQNLLKFKLKATNNPESSPESGLRLSSSYFDTAIAGRDEQGTPDFSNRAPKIHPTNRIPIAIPPLRSISKTPGELFADLASGGGFYQQMLPPGFRTNQFRSDYSPPNNNNNNNFADPSKRASYWPNINPNSDPRPETRGSKRGRERDELAKIVASIKLVGEGFLRVEREKMAMAREIEGMRMEMEMKKNQMLLEFQREIVEAFRRGMLELKKMKEVGSDGAAGPGEP
ncbi:Alcohol dehydrogenase transcription factor Myb/SANT-like family protein [Striga hermonthica]|uniref:Alcohol dehydrogenase transcription factor Myb/SANT-like family protein n=1 Tax=Striga hermonthica TaxID=68872 RepID=A0A9N7NH87_STRHE|nr:Alcohol dehydrogenase transcription factor Myb/SANT-like family protein [Striga hermonthica]